MNKEYNPLEHSVVQALMKADACNQFEVERGGYIHCLLKGVVDEIEHVYRNWNQASFEDHEDWQFLEIPGFEYRRYWWGDCDCGAESPVHAKDCREVAEHNEWNRERLAAISEPMATPEEIEAAKAINPDPFSYLHLFCSRLNFGGSEEKAYIASHPHPPCTCGGVDGWKEREYHLQTCSPTLPNMHFEEVRINWYKYLGRGTSTNVDWNEKQWREWYDRAIKAIELYDVCMQTRHKKFRDEDAGLKAFSTDDRVQCKDCKYCVSFGANCLIWNRAGGTDVYEAED